MTDGEMFFKKMELSDLQCNPFDMIGKSWYLLTSGTPEDYNTMTASWGAMGEIWGAPSFHCVVRTNRYTLQYLDRTSCFQRAFSIRAINRHCNSAAHIPAGTAIRRNKPDCGPFSWTEPLPLHRHAVC